MGHRTDRGAEEFVLARWPDLVRTALLVRGDRDAAVDLTVRVLASLLDEWDELLEEGTPAATARRRLVAALDAADQRREPRVPPMPTPTEGHDPGGPEPAVTTVGDPMSARGPTAYDPMSGALLAAYDALPLAARVALALRHLEGHDPVGAAAESGLPVVRVRAELEVAIPLLVAAHDETRARRRAEDAPESTATTREEHRSRAELPAWVWHALDIALESRLRTIERTEDPLALVATVRRAGRRRRTAVGIALVAAAALVAVLAVTQAGDGPPPATVAAAPGAPWGDALTWPVRGGLATNPGVRATVRDRWGADTRLLYAGVFGGSRVIVGLTPSTEGAYQVQTLISPNGQPRDDVVGRTYDIGGAPTALALIGVPTGASVPLLVLGRPDVDTAETSATVTYAAGGRALRQWRAWPLDEGVGELTLPVTVGTDQPVLPGLRVRLPGLDGPAVNQAEPSFQMPVQTCDTCSTEDWRAGTTAATVARISAATGIPEDAVRATDLATGPVADVVTGSNDVGEPIVRAGDFTCTRYDLPDGTTLVSTALRFTDGAQDPWPGGGRLTRLPPGTPADERPCLQISGVDGYGAVHYVCAVPDASAIRLVGTSGSGAGRVQPQVRLSGRIGTVSAPAALLPDRVRLVVLDRGGQPVRTYAFGDLVRWRDPFDGGSLFDV